MPVALAVCALFKNEARFLAEWIEFHRLAGVGHFLLYDDHSEDDPRAILDPYVGDGIVTLIDWPIRKSAGGQIEAFRHCLEHHRDDARWIAFIDLDEFLFSPERESVPEVLNDYEAAPGVFVHWRIYGSSGIEDPGDGLVIETFTRRAPDPWVRNQRGKSIVDPRRATGPDGVHFFHYATGASAVDENHEAVRVAPLSRIHRFATRWLVRAFPSLPLDPFRINKATPRNTTAGRLRINHYMLRGLRSASLKRASYGPGRTKRYWDLYVSYHDRNDVEDPVLASWAPRVREAIHRRFGERRTENGERRTENGERRTENGERSILPRGPEDPRP